MTKSYLKLLSESFDESKPFPIKFEFTVTLGKMQQSLEKELIKEDDEEEEVSDTLFIKFKQKNKISEELQSYIEENLGMYELLEDENEKIMVFELKINDIDFQSIQ